jgi:hypothetical protein
MLPRLSITCDVFWLKKTTHCKDASKEMCFIIKGLIGLLVESLTWPREQCSVDTCMAADLLPVYGVYASGNDVQRN